MKTLKDIIIEKHIRTGKAWSTTKHGAYWCLTGEDWFCKLRRAGGDGIGASEADITYWLDFRHFRDGAVRAVICKEGWHQNSGTYKAWIDADKILSACTSEDVDVALKSISHDGDPVYSTYQTKELNEKLAALGIPESLPAPDDAPIAS
jgi:hypothetical protein